jgi:hypothetical protein
MLLDEARKMALVGGPVMAVGSLVALGAAVYCAIQSIWIGVAIGGVFGVLFALGSYGAFTAPKRTLRHAPNRPCYVLTNRRLFLHTGSGVQVNVMEGGLHSEKIKTRIVHYNGAQLLRLCSVEHQGYDGAGDLYINRNHEDTATGVALCRVAKVRSVEKLVREKLIHPLIAKLLRGERPNEEEAADFQDDNVKDAPGVRKKKGEDNDPNIKSLEDPNIKRIGGAPKPFDIKRVKPEHRKTVEAELTSGEKVLWIGAPQGERPFGVFVETDKGPALRIEPFYVLYAITNLRVMLFGGGGSLTYYPPHLLGIGVEEDDRIPDGGSLIFRLLQVTITERDNQGRKTIRGEMRYFGMLRIQNVWAVADLLRENLLDPWRGEDD